MQSMDAATGKLISAEEHYELLIDEGNDPVLDLPVLKAYMNGWDGAEFWDMLEITQDSRVLEIGVGTGRLALKALERGCAQFTGIDLSPKTLETAARHLQKYTQVHLIRGEFPKDAPDGLFDRIYSSLTFMHIPDKEAAVRKIANLLAEGGRVVLSLDKQSGNRLDMGTRCVRLYPDDPYEMGELLRKNGLSVHEIRQTERAWLVSADYCKNC